MEAITEHHAVLVVEDEAILRTCAVAMLEDAGHLVLEAQNSEEALEILADHDEIGIVVTDVRMPGHMSGLDLVAKIQKERPLIRSIVVSGNATPREAFNSGASAFVQKPYSRTAIVDAVSDTLRLN